MPDQSANDAILLRALAHAVFLQRYKSHVVEDIVGFLNREVTPVLTARIISELNEIAATRGGLNARRIRKLQEMEQVTQGLIRGGLENLEKRAASELTDFAATETEWQIQVMRQQLPVQIETVVPAPVTLKAIVEKDPFNGDLLSGWFDSIGAATERAIKRQINIGLVGGESIGDIVRRIEGTRALGFNDGIYQTARRNLEAVVRSAVNHVSTQARQYTFDENEAVISGVQWVSTLDSRTSLICIDRDGKVFPIKSGPRPPAHFNCRSTIIPVLKSWKELGIDLAEAPEGTRASLNGQVAARITYPEWLSVQSRELQDEVLGPARAGLFRSGKVSVDRFIDRKGRTLTLKQLRQRIGLDN